MRPERSSRFLPLAALVLSVVTLSAILIATQCHQRERATLEADVRLAGHATAWLNAVHHLTATVRAAAATGETRYLEDHAHALHVARDRENAYTLLQGLAASPADLALLDRAKQSADRLTLIETLAAEATRKRDLRGAADLVYGAPYLQGREAVVNAMDEFRRRVADRLAGERHFAHRLGRAASGTAACAGLLTLLLLLATRVIHQRHYFRPIRDLAQRLRAPSQPTATPGLPYQELETEIGEMARALEEYRQLRQELEPDRWIDTQRRRVFTALADTTNPGEYAQRLLSVLSPLVGAGHAGLYLLDDTEGCYALACGYGYLGRKDLPLAFTPGEGIVGQAALERRTIRLSEVPPGYIEITSGLGKATPKCIVAAPLVASGHILGVIEFASFHAWTDTQEALLEEITSRVAAELEVLRQRARLADLTHQLREQAEALRTRRAPETSLPSPHPTVSGVSP